MRKKLSISVAIGVVFITIALAALWPRNEGPLYDGKPVSYWLTHPKTNFFGSMSGRSGGGGYGLTFPKFDSNAVPYLSKALETKDGPAKKFYIQVWNRFPAGIRQRLPQPVPALFIKQYSVVALGQMGPEAKPAVPALLRVIKEDDDISTTVWAITVIENCGRDKNLHEALVTASSSTNSFVRKYAQDVLTVHGGADGPF